MILCSKCDKNTVPMKGMFCNHCQMNLSWNLAPKSDALDGEIIEHYCKERIKMGCQYCKNTNFAFEAGTKIEGDIKWYLMFVNCNECGKSYTDILEGRDKNGNNNNDKKTKSNNSGTE